MGLKEGNATLEILVYDRSLWKNKALLTKEVIIDLTPPTLSLFSRAINARPGGSAVVVYGSSKPLINSGVMIGNRTYKGFPASGGNNTFVAFFALPLASQGGMKAKVFGEDLAGNSAQVGTNMNIMKRVIHSDR